MPDHSSKNTTQANPANAGTDFDGWPDWNSAKGVGKPSEGERVDHTIFNDIYAAQREGAAADEELRKAEFEKSLEPHTPAK